MKTFPKSRPRALDAQDRKRTEEALYRKNRQIALTRDGRRCRICGADGYLETHHVARRSAFGAKRVLEKHDPSNLLSVCAGVRRDGVIACHDLLTKNVLKAVSLTDRGTNGPVLVTKWDDREGGYVTFRKAA